MFFRQKRYRHKLIQSVPYLKEVKNSAETIVLLYIAVM
jgi:hypothetical protein